jgi:uncharacterized protein (DUF342 family)
MPAQHDTAESSEGHAVGGREIKKNGYSLVLKIPSTLLECRCTYVPHEVGSMITRDDLADVLKQNHVLAGIDQQAFEDFSVSAAAGRQLSDVLLASGTPAVKGADGFFVITVQPSTTILSGEEDVTKVDMHIVQTFINVSNGEEIGRIIPPEPGVPGQNIMGQVIAPQKGKPYMCKIGKNITISNGSILVAAATGRFCQTPGELSVEEEYIVKGDVNFKVGAINFNGIVEVRGDVLDNFDITATKGLTVTGNIGVCSIVSGGDVTFCGMDGQSKGSIVCGGTLHAHFMHDVDVVCAGDVIVDVEIHNCSIKTLGRIVVDKGFISGGSCKARGGIEAKNLGSPSGQHTKLMSGVNYQDREELRGLCATLAETEENAIQSQLDCLADISFWQKKTSELHERIKAIKCKTDEASNPKINVKATLHENVRLKLGDATETIKEQRDGPLTIIENSIEGGLRYLPMTSLDVRATDMELACIRDQKTEATE